MNPKLRAAPLLLAAMLLFVLSSALPAQTRSERTNADRTGRRTTSAGRALDKTTPKKTPGVGSFSRSTRGGSRPPLLTSDGKGGVVPAKSLTNREPADEENQSTGEESTGEESTGNAGQGFAASMRNFVKEQYVWILVLLGLGLLGVVSWVFLGARSKKGTEPFLEPIDNELDAVGSKRSSAKSKKSKRFSSTRIRASDVNARLSSGVTTEEVETDREYALVVEEAALIQNTEDVEGDASLPHEEHILECLEQNDHAAAYAAYLDVVDEDGTAEFRPEVERALSEHFLNGRDFDKAARILEHQVATRSADRIDPETYFNLGYIHFQTKTVNKSRRFFKLFVETDARPEYIARAKRILAVLGDGVGQN